MTVSDFLNTCEYIDIPVGILAQTDDMDISYGTDEVIFDCESYPCDIPENLLSLEVDFFIVEEYQGKTYFKIFTNGLASKLRRY